MQFIKSALSGIFLMCLIGCMSKNPPISDEEYLWRLGWRMVESQMDEDFDLANRQFDSLMVAWEEIDIKFLARGLEIKDQLNLDEEINSIVAELTGEERSEVCQKEFLKDHNLCEEVPEEVITNPSLQLEIIKMYVDDQASRGNILSDIIKKYAIDSSAILVEGGMNIDKKNRNRLKEIIDEYGFPTRSLVGTKAMEGVFIIIQHADRDPGWQRSQLPAIEKAVKNGDMNGQSYTYLYDRIQINAGEKQRYGTQFSNVDPINKVVTLADIEDMETLNDRRREVGMMPIEMYKRIVLK